MAYKPQFMAYSHRFIYMAQSDIDILKDKWNWYKNIYLPVINTMPMTNDELISILWSDYIIKEEFKRWSENPEIKSYWQEEAQLYYYCRQGNAYTARQIYEESIKNNQKINIFKENDKLFKDMCTLGYIQIVRWLESICIFYTHTIDNHNKIIPKVLTLEEYTQKIFDLIDPVLNIKMPDTNIEHLLAITT